MCVGMVGFNRSPRASKPAADNQKLVLVKENNAEKKTREDRKERTGWKTAAVSNAKWDRTRLKISWFSKG